MKKAIINKTEGVIIINGLKGAILYPSKQNHHLIVEFGESATDTELIGLEQAGLIQIVDLDSIPQDSQEQKPTPTKKSKKPKEQESINDASGSEVTVVTEDGVKKSKMKYSAVRVINPPPEPEMLDLDKY